MFKDKEALTIETERLILRAFRQEDLNDFYEYCRNPAVGPNAGWKPHESIEESQGILERFIEGNNILAITDKSNGKVIGSIGVHNDNTRSYKNAKMIGYVLSRDFWGKGIMCEAVKAVMNYAFTQTETDLLSVAHYPFNSRSKRVIEKCGFRHEGTLRKASVIYDGSVFDQVCYSITKEEWEYGKQQRIEYNAKQCLFI